MKSNWALWSLGIIFASLAFGLITSYWLSELHRCAYYNAENDWAAWESRFKKYRRGEIKNDPWPATAQIEYVNFVTRIAKTGLPLIAGLILVVGAFRQNPQSVASATPDITQQTLLLNVSTSVQSEFPSSLSRDVVAPKHDISNSKGARHSVSK